MVRAEHRRHGVVVTPREAIECGARGAWAWIPVSEALPNVDENVLVTYVHGLSGTPSVCEAAYRGQWDADDPPSWDSNGWPIQDVLAWLPLPAAWVNP